MRKKVQFPIRTTFPTFSSMRLYLHLSCHNKWISREEMPSNSVIQIAVELGEFFHFWQQPQQHAHCVGAILDIYFLHEDKQTE